MANSYNGLIHFDQGANSLTVESGGKYGACGSVQFTLGTETASAIAVDIQAYKPNGDTLDRQICLYFALCDSSGTGAITGTAASGGIAAGAAGSVLIQEVTGKMAKVLTNSSGVINLSVTHTGATNYYPMVVLPSGEITLSSSPITFT